VCMHLIIYAAAVITASCLWKLHSCGISVDTFISQSQLGMYYVLRIHYLWYRFQLVGYPAIFTTRFRFQIGRSVQNVE